MPHPKLLRATDAAEAVAFLTRFPVPAHTPRGAASAWAWPLAGALVGLVAAATATLALTLGMPPTAAAALVLTTQAVATGALHEDGLADSADGLWGGGTPERRLEIMRDSRIGSYGALALILSVLLRWSALTALLAHGSAWGPLLAAGALSRWPMAWMLRALPPARDGGLSRFVGRPNGATVAVSGALAMLLALLAEGWAALAVALAVLAVTLFWTAAVRSRLRGQTGDTCGAVQQLSEVAALLALAA